MMKTTTEYPSSKRLYAPESQRYVRGLRRKDVLRIDTPKVISGHVLLIDDDDAFASLVSKAIEPAGMDVSRSKTGEEGFNLARSNRPTAVLLDLCLPDTSGIDMLSRFRQFEETIDIPVLVLTGLHERDLAYKLRKAGAKGIYRKPVDFQQVIDHIADFLS